MDWIHAEPVPVEVHPGETNESWLQPIGAGVVIPPWNFPLAILVGMTVGPVAAGNTVVLKPASNTPLVGMGLGRLAYFEPAFVDELGPTRIQDLYVVSTPLAGPLLRIELDPGAPVKAGRTAGSVGPAT